LPNDSAQKLRPSKRQSLWDQENDGEPNHGRFSAGHTHPLKWKYEIEFDETEDVEMRGNQ